MPLNSELQGKFDEAVVHLSKHEYKEGIDALTQIRAKGFVSADLEANLGHALVEVGQVGPGLQHLMNSVALARWRFANRDDLRFAQAKVESGLGLPASHPSEFGNQISSFVRPLESLAMASLLLLLFLGLLLLKQLKKRVALGLGLGVLIFLGLSIFATLGTSIYIVGRDAEMRLSPLESADVVQTLKNGTRLHVLRVSGEFTEVERSNAFGPGWVKSDSLFPSPY